MRIRPKITLRGFKPNAHGAGHVLGELETSVMELLWREAGLTVNQVEERLQRRRQIAHTTVLTPLDRMHRKGYLTREKKGKAFAYVEH
jgi:predicted transcriptional regulator